MLFRENQKEQGRKPNPAQFIIFGEVLYDCFSDTQRVLGGAPFNVAWGLCGFGNNPLLVSSVGMDKDGEKIADLMQLWGMSMEGMQTHREYETGEVFVSLNGHEPSYDICRPRAWDDILDTQHSSTEWIYHGSLALRSEQNRETLKAIFARSDAKRFFDINLRQPFYSKDLLEEWLYDADWIKLNIDELCEISENIGLEFTTCDSEVNEVMDKYAIKNVLLTAGSEGAMIVGDNRITKVFPAPKPKKMVDTVGAGDSFTAVCLHGLLNDWSPQRILEDASQFAAKVCGISGATINDKAFYQI